MRYNPARLNGPLSAVVAPPYDVISLEDQDVLYKRHPYNCVRLILGRQFDGDSPTDNRYTRAHKHLEAWRQEGAIAEDVHPAFYIYEQTYQVLGSDGQSRSYTRRGVLTALKLEPFGTGSVYPHEETFASHKADRLRLMQACRANFSPVFGLVPDQDHSIEQHLAAAIEKKAPDAEIKEESGIVNKLWVVTDAAFCKKLAELAGPRKVFIADGHHRYETACLYREERMLNDSTPNIKGDRAFNYVLMMCVPMNDPGLLILPTHRMVAEANNVSAQAFLTKAGEHFTTRNATDTEIAVLAETREGPIEFGLVAAGGAKHILTVKPGAADAMAKACDKSQDWRDLDVAVLHQLLLKNILGLNGHHKGPNKEPVVYTKDHREVFERVGKKSEFPLGFVMRPTRIEQVRAVAEHGEKMPHKSTFFYPKLLSGLVMRSL